MDTLRNSPNTNETNLRHFNFNAYITLFILYNRKTKVSTSPCRQFFRRSKANSCLAFFSRVFAAPCQGVFCPSVCVPLFRTARWRY